MTPALIEALNHPIRRQLLRLLHEHREAQSPKGMSQEMTRELVNISYHARVLLDLHVIGLTRTRSVRGSIQHFYVSRVAKNNLVAVILRSTEKDDSFLRVWPGRKKKKRSG
jgi:hypothetical protein